MAVTTVLEAWRDRGLGVPVTPEILIRVGVSESLARRTFQSLVGLDLLTEQGQPTEQFQDFRSTRGEDEYRARLQEWIRSVYADVLQYADPASQSHERITEAFRTYEPAGQRRSMAALLLGLWKYAGLPVATSTPSNGGNRRVAVPTSRPARKAPAVSHSTDRQTPRPPAGGTQVNFDGLPPGLIGLLQQIPKGGSGWTEARRDAFLAAFSAVLNFTVPIEEEFDPFAPSTGEEMEDDL